MTQNIKAQIAALTKMSPGQLREKHLEVFGEPTRSGNRAFLVKRIAWRIQSLAEGGLSERARQRAAELARDADIRITAPRMPVASGGGTTQTTALPTTKASGIPTPGAVLTRQYQGRLIEVTVLPKGFEWEGNVYRSLSGVAKAVTGSHWNGQFFFGLRPRNGDKQ